MPSRLHGALQTTLPNGLSVSSIDDVISLLASCVLLLLFEKLSGEGEDIAIPHLQFFAQIFPAKSLPFPTSKSDGVFSLGIEEKPWSETVRFLLNLFFYNDLVGSTSCRVPTLSDFYAETSVAAPPSFPTDGFGPFRPTVVETDLDQSRFILPNLIARSSAGDPSVTDEHIADWDGRFDWFPSFALVVPEQRELHNKLPTADPRFVLNNAYQALSSFTYLDAWDERGLVAELYRVAATIYRKRCALEHNKPAWTYLSTTNLDITEDLSLQMGNLPSWGIELLQQLPRNSDWENCLLWPISIVAKELTEVRGREYITTRLSDLERRFRLKLYRDTREYLRRFWLTKDGGDVYRDTKLIMCG